MNEMSKTLIDVIDRADREGYQLIRWQGSANFYLADKTGQTIWGNRGTTLADLTVFLALPSAP